MTHFIAIRTRRLSKIFPVIALVAVAMSCSDVDTTPVRNLSRYYPGYMEYSTVFLPDASVPNVVQIERDTYGRIIRRTGGLLPMPSHTPYPKMFSPHIYDEVTYDGSRITIISKDEYPDIDIPPYRKELTLRFGKIVQAIVINDRHHPLPLYSKPASEDSSKKV